MSKNYSFYRGILTRKQAVDGEPGLLAATEVVQAVCDAGFQRNGFSMKSYPSSPHCYYKFAKTPKEGMYKLIAVRKSDMTTLGILIDTRIYPCFMMLEKNADWQGEKGEVVETVELLINIGAEMFYWHISLIEYRANATEHLEEFMSALSFMKDIECRVWREERERKDEAYERRSEELFHFVHPEIEDDEAWRIHDAIKRLVAYQKVPEICQYLHMMANNNKILLPKMPSVAYAELVRMGMPETTGFSENNLKKYYRVKSKYRRN